ncbi:exonuclease domain-containing protein [bacterium]|nr:exonuclease domain-containing protein [bacterium]
MDASISMPANRIAVIDVETTGLSPWRNDRIVEIAIVVISPDGTIHAEYDTLVNPNRDMGPARIHQISSADVLQAPAFADIAGDVLEILANVNVVAGHNVSFDKNFLVKEYDRMGVAIPDIPLLCTCQLFGRGNLEACCAELDISFDGMPHRALSDARATSQIVSYLCTDDPAAFDAHRLTNISWPSIPALRTPRFRREHAQEAQDKPPNFLQRIAGKIHHDTEVATPNLLAYLALIDRVLEDRTIDANEEDTLVDAAVDWNLSSAQLHDAHTQYIHSLAVLALADGIVTDTERRDLHLIAKLLGQDDSTLDSVLESAAAQLASVNNVAVPALNENTIRGQRVCFTGELLSKLEGQPITRDMAKTLAIQAGLTIASSVTKKLDILVVADPNTQSGKATKARKYGIRILSDAVFWRMVGVPVD